MKRFMLCLITTICPFLTQSIFADTLYYCPETITLTKLDSARGASDCTVVIPGGQQAWSCRQSGYNIESSQLPLTLHFSEAHTYYTSYDLGADCTYGDFPGGSKILATVIGTNALSAASGPGTQWAQIQKPGIYGYHYECDSSNPEQCPMKQTFSKES